MIVAPLLALSLAAAAGEIYHCRSDDGSVRFQDQPCDTEQLDLIRSKRDDGQVDLGRLRDWLDSTEKPGPSASTDAAPVRHRPRDPSLPPRPRGEAAVAACSERFLHCAGQGPENMDRCVSSLIPCSQGRRAGCCNVRFLERYDLLRSGGVTQREAVRHALLADP